MKKILSIMALLVFFSIPVSAAVVIDQNQPNLDTAWSYLAPSEPNAQSFMQTNSNIAGAGIYLVPGYGNPDTVTISVWDALPNQIGSTQLATGSATGTQGFWVDVFWTPISVIPATTYYLDFTGTTPFNLATGAYQNSDTYASGDLYYRTSLYTGVDFAFRTYYDDSFAAVPEPSTLLLLGSGLIGLVGFGRKRMRK